MQGLSAISKCLNALEKAVTEDSMSESLKKSKCSIPPVICEYCEKPHEKDRGYYTLQGVVHICTRDEDWSQLATVQLI